MLQNILPLLLLLQEGAPADAAPAQPGASPLSGPMFPLLIVGGLFFFLLIRPERKKQKLRQAMLSAIKKGDRVMTSSGIFGSVISTTEEIAVLQVAENVRMRFSRGAIQSVIQPEKDAKLEAEPSKA